MHSFVERWTWFGLLTLVLGVFLTPGALAHHGWGWATDRQVEITGTITDVRLGYPHGEVTLDVEGERWVIEVGQPWRNERAGLTEELLGEGRVITALGHRSAREGEKLVKAVRVVIDGKNYDLYPGRVS